MTHDNIQPRKSRKKLFFALFISLTGIIIFLNTDNYAGNNVYTQLSTSKENSFNNNTGIEIKKLSRPTDEDIVRQILIIIKRWRLAWATWDIDAYMSFYSKNASIQRITVDKFGDIVKVKKLDKEGLKVNMNNLKYQYYDETKVEISAEEITLLKDYSGMEIYFIEARLIQLFSAGKGRYKYTDIGTKILKFINENNAWKIVDETWRPLKDKMNLYRKKFPHIFQK